MKVFTGDSTGVVTRRLLPAAILLPVILGWLALEGQRMGLYGTLFGLTLFATSMILVFTILIGLSARQLHEMDAERKKIEGALRQSEERFRLLVEGVNEYAIFMLDPEGYVASWNAGAERINGYQAEEVIGKHFSCFYTREDVERGHPEEELRIAASESRYEEEGLRVRKDGSWFWANVLITALRDKDGNLRGYSKIVRDITERKRVEEELREAEERFRSAFDEANIGMALVEPGGRFIQVNRSLCEMLGRTKEELLNTTFREITHPDDLDISVDQVRQLIAGEIESYQLEKRYLHAEGHAVWVSLNVSAVRDAAEQPVYLIAHMQDITDRKEADEKLELFNAELQRSNRELQEFASVASHDLQEPLRKVRAFGDRLKTRYADSLDARGFDYLERMQNAAERMQNLINDLLTYSRVTTRAQPFVEVDLSQITREVLSDLETSIARSGGKVEVGNLPTVDADPTQMRQVMQNLISNALKFHKEGEPPVVNVSGKLLNGVCEISVQDRGIGLEEKHADRIFGVFERLHTRQEYDGTGVGLAVCKKIVERHGGRITVRSKPGEGATFHFTLPVKHDEEAEDE